MDAFLNALKAVSNTFPQHIVKLFHRPNRAFISQPLLLTQGPWVHPGKKRILETCRVAGEVLSWCLKKDSVKPDLVLSQAPLSLPYPATACSLFHLPPRSRTKGNFGRST